MPPLPRVTAAELRRALLHIVFVEDRQRGSHLVLRHGDDPSRFADLAIHSRAAVPPGTLRHIPQTTRVAPEERRQAL